MSGGKGSFDKVTVFSPEGNLYQVEYAFRAVRAAGTSTCVAIRGADAVVIVSQRKLPDRLMKGDSLSSLTRIDGAGLGAVMVGRAPDCRFVVNYVREIAAEYKYDCGHAIPIGLLAKRAAGRAQVRTQEAGYRCMGTATVLLGLDIDDATGAEVPRLYKVDPAGHYAGCFAAASGAKEVEAVAELEKLMPPRGDGVSQLKGVAEVGTAALRVLQKVLGQSLKAGDVEIGQVSVANPNFSRVPDSDVEKWLEAIATAD